jgi:hypothetical protein
LSLLLLGPPLFFLCPPPFNWDDWELLAHAMASDFSVAWQSSIPFYNYSFLAHHHVDRDEKFADKYLPYIKCL